MMVGLKFLLFTAWCLMRDIGTNRWIKLSLCVLHMNIEMCDWFICSFLLSSLPQNEWGRQYEINFCWLFSRKIVNMIDSSRKQIFNYFSCSNVGLCYTHTVMQFHEMLVTFDSLLMSGLYSEFLCQHWELTHISTRMHFRVSNNPSQSIQVSE